MIRALYFTYAGINSSDYGLMIADFDSNNVGENEAFSPALHTSKAPITYRFYHNGITYDSPPAFEFSVVSEKSISPQMRSEILSWLVGRRKFLPLKFLDNESEQFTYYAVFTSSQTIYVNGECHGFRLRAEFDSPFARGGMQRYDVDDGPSISIMFENKSNVMDMYTYPIVTLKTSSGGGTVVMSNETDAPNGARLFTFVLNANEKVVIDNEAKIIRSYNGQTGSQNTSAGIIERLTSKNWFRLRNGANNVVVSSPGGVLIECPYYAMVGY